ncbi:MAG: hypothetical protein ACI4BH_10090 [Muribaculaceae bacterium]
MRKLCPSCQKPKVLFASELEARKYIKNHRNKAANVHLKPYYCEACQAWHLTHKVQ